MAGLPSRNSRYQREQRINVASWAVLMLIGAALAAYHGWSTARSVSSDAEDASPVAPTMSMQVWLDQSQVSITGLVTARNNIAAAASRHDIPATGTACRFATDAVADLRNHMPSPEAAVNQTLQQAISSYTTGLPYCISSTQPVDAEGLHRAAGYISQGDTAMQSALDILADESETQPGALGVLIV